MFMIHSPMALAAFHTAASLVGLAMGPFVLRDLFASRRPGGLAMLFLALMAIANFSGFLFPARYIGVGHVSGAVSVAALAAATAACAMRCSKAWAAAYAIGVTTLLYCDTLITVFMLFSRVPFLHQAGPGSVLGIQLVVLGTFVALGLRGVASFHPDGRSNHSFVTVRQGGRPIDA